MNKLCAVILCLFLANSASAAESYAQLQAKVKKLEAEVAQLTEVANLIMDRHETTLEKLNEMTEGYADCRLFIFTRVPIEYWNVYQAGKKAAWERDSHV